MSLHDTHNVGGVTVRGRAPAGKHKHSPAACGAQNQENTMSDPIANITEPAAGLTTENTASTPESATPVVGQTETAPEAPAVEAAPEPAEVADESAPASDQLPTVASFIAPIGAGKGEASFTAEEVEVSFSRKGSDMTFGLKAKSVTVSGKRV